MSKKNVKVFFEKVEEDKNLQAKLKTLYANAQKQKDSTTAELIKIAEDAGFQFTPSDLAAVRNEDVENLSVDGLKSVVLSPSPLDCMPGWKYEL